MDILITPRPLAGTISAPPSKSQLLRALLCASLCESETVLHLGGSVPLDALVMISSLRSLGAEITPCGDFDLRVKPISTSPAVSDILLECAESGSTLRFLSPVAAALGMCFTATGSGRLPVRPLCSLPSLLSAHGCRVSGEQLPFTCSGQLESGEYIVDGSVSSQHISGLLTALPLLCGDSKITISACVKPSGYLQMTVEMLRRFGIETQRCDDGFSVRGNQKYTSPGEIYLEGDWSGASFFLTAGAFGGDVTLQGLSDDSLQPDRAALSFLKSAGASVRISHSPDAFSVRGDTLRPFNADVARTPDLAPALAVLMCAANGTSVLSGAASLRAKESDRLHALCVSLGALGADISERESSLEIRGVGSLRGGIADSFGDHRIAMALAAATPICSDTVTVTNVGCVDKSYPVFFKDFISIGGRADVL